MMTDLPPLSADERAELQAIWKIAHIHPIEVHNYIPRLLAQVAAMEAERDAAIAIMESLRLCCNPLLMELRPGNESLRLKVQRVQEFARNLYDKSAMALAAKAEVPK